MIIPNRGLPFQKEHYTLTLHDRVLTALQGCLKRVTGKSALVEEDLETLFCSTLMAEEYKAVGLIDEVFFFQRVQGRGTD